MPRPTCLLALVLSLGCVPQRPIPPGATVDLVIAATTDPHGRVRSWDYYANRPDTIRGLDRAATIMDSLRATAPGRVLLVDAGDLLQGNPFTFVAAHDSSGREHPVIAAMNAMHYDAAAIGNHEFNYGVPLLDTAAREASFPFLAANAYRTNGGRAYPAWAMVERRGVKIAIIGATTPGSMLWDRDHLQAAGIVIRDIVPAVRQAVSAARDSGAQAVIVVVHSGLDEPSSYDTVNTGVASENVAARIAHEVHGIDLLVYGHSHKEMADTVIDGTLLMQPKNWAQSVGVAHLVMQKWQGGWQVISSRSTVVKVAGHAPSAAVDAATEQAHAATVAWVTTPIGTTTAAWRGDSARVADVAITDFVGEVMRRAAHADLAATAQFTLDAHLGPGPITVADVAQLYPYDNTLRAVRITGAQLRAFLEHAARYYAGAGDSLRIDPHVPGYNFDIVTGADYTIDLSKPVGSRITSLSVKGKPVTDTDTFTFAVNNYRQTGGGGFSMLANAPLVYDQEQDIRQLLIDEVRRVGTLRLEDYATKNWSITPASLVPRAYELTHQPIR